METEASERFEVARREMVRAALRGRGIKDERVLAAMERVPRERFVPESLRTAAYADRPLSIGLEQTISQPLMVATMLAALELRGDERVLEVGAGSGYLAALLGELAREVIAVEIIPELAERARQTLTELGVTNVRVELGDGSVGYPPAAPYDAIVISAGAPDVPFELLAELGPAGRLVIPVGREPQELVRMRRRGATFSRESLGGCSFVPLTGERGWD